MFTKRITNADVGTTTSVINCTKTRRAAFVLASTNPGEAKEVEVHLEGSIDQNEWVQFGTMKLDTKNPAIDGGNAEFVWPHIRCKIIKCTADSDISIFTRV